MPDYKNGKIYCIRSPNTDKVYVGSTTQSLSQRFFKHKSAFKCCRKRTGSKHLFEAGDAYIELIENYPCDNRTELNRREGKVMRTTPNCCNSCIAGRTQKEYYNEHKEQILKNNKKYKKKHEAKFKEYKKKWDKDHPERVKAIKRKYYESKKEKVKARAKAKGKEAWTCECGWEGIYGSRRLHLKSKKHANTLAGVVLPTKEEKRSAYYQKNKDNLLTQQKATRANWSDEKKQQVKEYMRNYHTDNKVKVKAKRAEIYQRDKEKIKARVKAYSSQIFECECGVKVRMGSKTRHFKSNKHKDILNSKLI